MNLLEKIGRGGKVSDYYPYAFHKVKYLGGKALLGRSVMWFPPAKSRGKVLYVLTVRNRCDQS